jgi:N-acetylmuramoyl-L-alanine amidase
MNRIFFILFFFTVLFASASEAQVSFNINGSGKKVSSFDKNGMMFVSLKETADALGIPYYYNPTAYKYELKFAEARLKFTAINQFVVLTYPNNNNRIIYQLPVSCVKKGDDVYIPIKYSLDILSRAYQKGLFYNEKDKTVSLGLQPPIAAAPDTMKTASYDVYEMEIEGKANGTLIRVKSRKPFKNFTSSIYEGALYLTLMDMTVDEAKIKITPLAGLVNSIAYKRFTASSQITFVLNEGYTTTDSFIDPGSGDLIITVHNSLLSDNSAARNKEGASLDVVVIDAGHGGKDPGAIGVGGLKEKDVNLAVAKKLGQLIKENMPGVKVVYTRSEDNFVELYKRGKIANENKGKLFLSIHCNSMPHKKSETNGYEIYLLRPGRTDEAIAIAEVENSVINYEDNPDRYQKLTDENFILVSMAHSSYMRYSERFADILNKTLARQSTIDSKGVKQAGFYVLVGATMPSALIEIGFISNKNDAKFIGSKKGQEVIANQIYSAVKEYKMEYDKNIQMEL